MGFGVPYIRYSKSLTVSITSCITSNISSEMSSYKTSYRKISRCFEAARLVIYLNYCTALRFDRHVGSSAVNVPVKFQSDRTALNTNLEASTCPLDTPGSIWKSQLLTRYVENIHYIPRSVYQSRHWSLVMEFFTFQRTQRMCLLITSKIAIDFNAPATRY